MHEERLPEFRIGGLKDRFFSPFSRYYRGKYSLSTHSIEKQAVLPFVTVSRDERIALVKNSKSGCTSIARAIHVYDKGHDFKGNIHREGQQLRQGYSEWQANYAVLKAPYSYVVSSIRHPEKRNPIRAFFWSRAVLTVIIRQILQFYSQTLTSEVSRRTTTIDIYSL